MMAETQILKYDGRILEGRIAIKDITPGPVIFRRSDEVFDNYLYHGIKKWAGEEEKALFAACFGEEYSVLCFQLHEDRGKRYIDLNELARQTIVPVMSRNTKSYQEIDETHKRLRA